MKRLALAFLISIAMGRGSISYAQDSLVGTCNGSFTVPTSRGDMQLGTRVIIASVENSVVKGTATVYLGFCSGNYPMEGNYDGNKLVMTATTKGGPENDCMFGFNVAQEGNKLIGLDWCAVSPIGAAGVCSTVRSALKDPTRRT